MSENQIDAKVEIKQPEEPKNNLFSVEDIYGHLDGSKTMDITKDYDPQYFWENYGDRYRKEFKKEQDFLKFVPWLLQKLPILKVDTLLDAGCGFGRIAPFLLRAGVVKKITGWDISQKQLDDAKVYLEGFEKNNDVTFEKRSIKWTNYPSNSFDCTLSIECMQHMNKLTARESFRTLKKLSKKYIIIIERYAFQGEHPAPHLWSHNYSELAEYLGLKVIESCSLGGGVIAMILKK